jgi:hypothetical protein
LLADLLDLWVTQLTCAKKIGTNPFHVIGNQLRTSAKTAYGKKLLSYLGFVRRLLPANTGTLTVGARHASDRADQRVARMAGSHMGGWKGSQAEGNYYAKAAIRAAGVVRKL